MSSKHNNNSYEESLKEIDATIEHMLAPKTNINQKELQNDRKFEDTIREIEEEINHFLAIKITQKQNKTQPQKVWWQKLLEAISKRI